MDLPSSTSLSFLPTLRSSSPGPSSCSSSSTVFPRLVNGSWQETVNSVLNRSSPPLNFPLRLAETVEPGTLETSPRPKPFRDPTRSKPELRDPRRRVPLFSARLLQASSPSRSLSLEPPLHSSNLAPPSPHSFPYLLVSFFTMFRTHVPPQHLHSHDSASTSHFVVSLSFFITLQNRHFYPIFHDCFPPPYALPPSSILLRLARYIPHLPFSYRHVPESLRDV